MKNDTKIPHERKELEDALIEQLQFLRSECSLFDGGMVAVGKKIALTLRILLHSKRKNSQALLDQLGLHDSGFVSTAAPLDPLNIAADWPLLSLRFTPSGPEWIPRLASAFPSPQIISSFDEWWNSAVVKDFEGRTFTRRDLVTYIADTDGGAHVDPGLHANFKALSRENSLGFNRSTGPIKEEARPELPCMRQIAHELFVTLQRNFPDLRELVEPIVPKR